jgi:glycosyltransferase involved in cell wall biosynthesis
MNIKKLKNRFHLVFYNLFNKGWKGLWIEIKQYAKQLIIPHEKVEEISKKELYDNQKRLMIVTPTMEMGGVEKVTSILLRHIDRSKIKVELVNIFDRKGFYEIPEDIKVYTLQRQANPEPFKSDIELPHNLKIYSNDLDWLQMNSLKLLNIIKKRKPSVVLAQDYYASIISVLGKKYMPLSIKLILSVHNDPKGLFSTDNKGPLYAYIVKSMFCQADKIIAISNSLKREFVKNWNITEENIAILYNPVDILQILKLAEETIYETNWFDENIPIILYVGRIVFYKGLDYLLKAISIIVSEGKEIRCVIIGDGVDKPSFVKLAEDLNIKDNVLFLSKTKNPYKFMKRATMFVLPSLTEGFPNVLSEAMACGCPVIATNSSGGGIAELLQGGKYGLLIPPKDENLLAIAIKRFLDDTDFRMMYSELAREKAKDFDIDTTIRVYEDLILT